MKIRDTLNLSFKKLKSKPKSSTYLILSISAILSLIFLINFLFFGFRNFYLDYSALGTNGKVALNVWPNDEGASNDEILSDIKRFHGYSLGKAKYYDNYTGVILPEDLVAPLLTENLASLPISKIPMLVSTYAGESFLDHEFSGGLKNFETYKNSVLGKTFSSASGAKYFVVGLAPGNFHIDNFSFKNIDHRNNNIFNPILERISTSFGSTIIIDNGNLDPEKIIEHETQLTVVFDNYYDAYDFLKNGHANSAHTAFSNRSYQISYLAGPAPDVLYAIDVYGFIKNIICSVLGFVALIIIIFSFIRILDRDKKSRALYKSLGATTHSVRVIYISYFLETIIIVTLIALIIAGLITLFIFLRNEELTKELFTLALSLI